MTGVGCAHILHSGLQSAGELRRPSTEVPKRPFSFSLTGGGGEGGWGTTT